MSRLAVLSLALALGGCPTPQPVPLDAGLDAPPDLDAPSLEPDAPADAGRDAPLPGRDGAMNDAARPDSGPDLGPGSCATPLDFDALATSAADGSRTASIDLGARGDHTFLACSPDAAGPDAVLRMVAPESGRLVLETLGDDDTVLAVRSGCAGADLACNDDVDRIGGPARVVLDVIAGSTLLVVLDTFRDAGADEQVSVRASLLPTRSLGEACDPSGMTDACRDGACSGTPATCVATSNIGCTSPIDLDPLYDAATRHVTYLGTTEGAPSVITSSCATTPAPEVVHHFTMPFRGRVRADLGGMLTGAVALRTDCADATSELACERRGVIPVEAAGILEAGAELFFVVEGWEGDAGSYSLELSLDRIASDGEPCALGGRAIDLCDPTLVCRLEGSERFCRPLVCGDGRVEASAEAAETCDLGPDQAGDGCGPSCTYDDSCTTPIDLNRFGTMMGSTLVYDGTNVGATNQTTGTCANTTVPPGAERVFVYTSAASGTLEVETDDPLTRFDTVLYARTTCAGGGTEQCDDDIGGAGGTRSRIYVPVVPGTPVYLFVDGYRDTSRGAFRLSVTLR